MLKYEYEYNDELPICQFCSKYVTTNYKILEICSYKYYFHNCCFLKIKDLMQE